MTDKTQFMRWETLRAKDLPGGVQRKVFSTDHIMVVQYIYEPGAVFPKHQHPQEQIVIVDKGELEFWIKEEKNKYHLRPGSVLAIPGDIPHGASVVGDEVVESINIFHPIKEEFLSEAEQKPVIEQK